MTTKNIYQRILGVMSTVDYIQKSDKKVNNQYRFVSHDQVNATLHPVLVENGIAVIPNVTSLTQEGNRTTVCLNVAFVNVDNPADRIDVNAWGYGIDPSDKGPGKAVSYAYKYALLKTFCLETGDDPDQDQQSRYEPEKKPRAKSEKAMEEIVVVTPLTKAEICCLEDMLDSCDDVFKANVKSYMKTLEIDKISDLPRENYYKLHARAVRRLNELDAGVANG